jgi:polyisoprenoid-binding protein YceI
MRALFSATLLAVLVFAAPAFAKTWTVDYADSHIGFIGKQGGESFEGSFKSFTAAIDFDPAHPEEGKITASIDIKGVTAGSSDRDDNMPSSDWFDIAQFPKAEFATTGIRAGSSPSCYEASGALTIKGVSKDVTLPFCLIKEGDHSRARGRLILSRADYGVGVGQWSDEGTVAHAVTVTVDIAAK